MLLRRCARLLPSLAVALAACTGHTPAPPEPDNGRATYHVALASIAEPVVRVTAELPVSGDTLRMAQSWPCDLEPLCEAGWPLLVDALRVSAPDGRRLPVTPLGSAGWLVRGHAGRVRVAYEVHLQRLRQAGWPAPREAAFADTAALYVLGRALFVEPGSGTDATVTFELPPATRVTAPWPSIGGTASTFLVAPGALTENGVVFRRSGVAPVAVRGFTVDLALFGRWEARRAEVVRQVQAHLETFMEVLGAEDAGHYLAVFLEDDDMGGEAFLDTHALSADAGAPSAAWGRLVAHELFHHWNGGRLRGADYATSQWFQEGAAEFYAIVSMARNGLVTPAEAAAEFRRHQLQQRAFAGSLAESGTRKNRPFYGAATLTMLALDRRIREATLGRRSLDDLMRRMWHTHGATRRPFRHEELVEAASAVAGEDLAPFFSAHVTGTTPVEVEVGA